MAIQMRRGADSDFDASKMLPGELAVTTDGTRKVYAAFGTNDAKELASKDDVQGLINSFTSVVDREIAEAEQRIESKAETVLGTIPDEYEIVSQKADEAVRTKADAIVCTVAGVTPIATDSSDDYLRNLRIFGKTTQETTSGKNLLENTGSNATANGITYTINEDKSITVVGTATATGTYTIGSLDIEAGEYILTGCPSGGSGDTFMIAFGSQAYSDTGSGVTRSFTETTNVSVYLILTSGTVMNHTFYPMIRLASITDGEYEPYTGGKPSPSPSYPQPLESKGKWGNLAQYEALDHSGNNATIPESLNDVKQITMAVKPKSGTQQINYRITLGNGSYEYDSIVTANADNNKWYIKTRTLTNGTIKAIKIYSLEDASYTARTAEHIFVGIGTWNIDDNSYRPYSGQMEIESGVLGKNILENKVSSHNNYGINVQVNADKSIRIKGTATTQYTFDINPNIVFEPHKTYTVKGKNCSQNGVFMILNGYDSIYSDYTFRAKETALNTKIVIRIPEGVTVDTTLYPQIEEGEVSTEYTPYTKQSHISLVSDGLKGIPVTDASLATYTDENGQMWCADEVDLERGVYVQRINSIMFDGTKTYAKNDKTDDDNYLYYLRVLDKKDGAVRYEGVMCDKLQLKTVDEINQGNDFSHSGISVNLINAVYINVGYLMSENTSAEVANVLTENPLTVFYILATPIETPLTASEISSYKALHSNYKVTTVMNDCVANMEVTYNADTETWINNKIEARVASALASLALS